MGLDELEKILRVIKKFKGGLLLIDYGYFGNLNTSSLQSVRKHKKNNLLENMGDSDITSLVNFKLLENYFKSRDMKVSKTVSQGFFLKKIGILSRAEILSKNMSFSNTSKMFFRLQRLLDPRLMGELFKVIFAHNTNLKNIVGFK